MKKATFYFVFLLSLTFSCKRSNPNDPIVYRQENDPELEEAREDALSTLDYFVNSFNSYSSDSSYVYSIKTEFIEQGQSEHMWLSLLKIRGNYFQGVLNNDPEKLKEIKFGDTVSIRRHQIEDWLIYNSKNKKTEGGYSISVLEARQ